MERAHFAVAALNQTPLDWSGNLRRSISAVDEARSQGARLLLLPELCLTGYGCEDMFQSLDVARRALERFVSENMNLVLGVLEGGKRLWIHHLHRRRRNRP